MSKGSPQLGPKKPQTAYIRFCNAQRKASPEIAKLPVSEQGKTLGAKWTNLTPEEKEEYQTEYESDKKKYDEEMAEFVLTDEGKKMKLMKKTKKKVVRKQKSTSGYQCWLANERKELKERGEKFSVGEFSKLMSEKWKTVPDHVKAKCEMEAKEINAKKSE